MSAVGREGHMGGCGSAVIQRRSWEVMCIPPTLPGCTGALSISCRLLLTPRVAGGRDHHCSLLKCLSSTNTIKLEKCVHTHTDLNRKKYPKTKQNKTKIIFQHPSFFWLSPLHILWSLICNGKIFSIYRLFILLCPQVGMQFVLSTLESSLGQVL